MALLRHRQRRATRDIAQPQLGHLSIDEDDFCACLAALSLAMDMNRLVLVGLEHDH
jgi:hypothetical protein